MAQIIPNQYYIKYKKSCRYKMSDPECKPTYQTLLILFSWITLHIRTLHMITVSLVSFLFLIMFVLMKSTVSDIRLH